MRPEQIESNGGARAFLPEKITLPLMTKAVQGCRGCDLYKHATQAVFATLILKAACLGSYSSLAGWLYSTAWHTSKRFVRSR